MEEAGLELVLWRLRCFKTASNTAMHTTGCRSFENSEVMPRMKAEGRRPSLSIANSESVFSPRCEEK